VRRGATRGGERQGPIEHRGQANPPSVKMLRLNLSE